MSKQARSHLTYANVMATIAVFIALGGTSYAIATGSIGSREIADNGVRSKDIRNNDVRGTDIRKGTVRSSDVGDRSLLAKDFKAGQLPSGARGPIGLRGPKGDDGAPGISGLEQVFASSAVDSKSPKGATAVCPAGKRVIGSGGLHAGGTTGNDPAGLTDVVLDQIQPSDEKTVPGTVSVTAFEEEATAMTWSVTAFALCANVS